MAELKLTIDANKALRDRVEVRTAERDAAVAHLRAVLEWSNTERFAGRTRHENDAPSSARSFLDGLDELQTSPKTSKDLDLCDECGCIGLCDPRCSLVPVQQDEPEGVCAFPNCSCTENRCPAKGERGPFCDHGFHPRLCGRCAPVPEAVTDEDEVQCQMCKTVQPRPDKECGHCGAGPKYLCPIHTRPAAVPVQQEPEERCDHDWIVETRTASIKVCQSCGMEQAKNMDDAVVGLCAAVPSVGQQEPEGKAVSLAWVDEIEPLPDGYTDTDEFQCVWAAIKGWDIQRVSGQGYAGATGDDVKIILDALGLPEPVLDAPAVPSVGLNNDGQDGELLKDSVSGVSSVPSVGLRDRVACELANLEYERSGRLCETEDFYADADRVLSVLHEAGTQEDEDDGYEVMCEPVAAMVDEVRAAIVPVQQDEPEAVDEDLQREIESTRRALKGGMWLTSHGLLRARVRSAVNQMASTGLLPATRVKLEAALAVDVARGVPQKPCPVPVQQEPERYSDRERVADYLASAQGVEFHDLNDDARREWLACASDALRAVWSVGRLTDPVQRESEDRITRPGGWHGMMMLTDAAYRSGYEYRKAEFAPVPSVGLAGL